MNTAQNYGEGDSCAKSNSKAPQVNQPTVNNTVARHAPVKSYFTLDVSTLTSSDGTGPSQFDVLTEALSYSRDKAIDQMRTHLLEFAQGTEENHRDLASSLEYGELYDLFTKIEHLNNFTDTIAIEVSSVLHEYRKEVNNA